MRADTIIKDILDRYDSSSLNIDDLRCIATYLPIMSWISAPDAPARWFNPEWLDFMGRTEKTMENWAYQDFHHPSYIEKAVKKRFEATMSGNIWEDTFPLLGRDNQFHWLLSRGVPILDKERNIGCYFGFHLDVTHKIKTPKLVG